MSARSVRVSTTELAETCHKIPALLSYCVRCSRPNCRCAEGPGHGPYWFLRWRDRSGRHCRRYVRAADLEAVRTIVARRQDEIRLARREADEARAWFRAQTRLLREILTDLERLP